MNNVEIETFDPFTGCLVVGFTKVVCGRSRIGRSRAALLRSDSPSSPDVTRDADDDKRSSVSHLCISSVNYKLSMSTIIMYFKNTGSSFCRACFIISSLAIACLYACRPSFVMKPASTLLQFEYLLNVTL
jgi:hypothetical protein